MSTRSPGGVRRAAGGSRDLAQLDARIADCFACTRLVAWREQVARERRAAYAEEEYWGRPVPGFGDEHARVLVVGLAPAAHGANRTGRVFTGDRSGDWLFASLHRVGLANQPTSRHLDDGLVLDGVRVSAAVRCAPPANQPTPEERDTCAPWLEREVGALLPTLRAVVALGGFGWTAAWQTLGAVGVEVPRPRPRFGHGAEVDVPGPHRSLSVLGCYHPSQQNTFTGRLTEPMIDDVLGRAARL